MSAGNTEHQSSRAAANNATASGRLWKITEASDEAVVSLAEQAHLPVMVARLLWERGLRTLEDVTAYLQPSQKGLGDPFLLTGMPAAVERIIGAIKRSEPMLIYGDYDVDGTLATVLLKTAIDRITPRGRDSLVRYHIPHRIREGYGVQASVLAEAATQGVRLVISVDTGIRAFAAAQEAQELGLDLIVTDHHLPDAQGLPPAVAVINPNQAGCSYPEKNLCGAAVAWKLAEALLRTASDPATQLQLVEAESFEKLQRSLMKLVAIATIADAVPLTGENRVVAALGLAELRDIRQPGLRALMRLAQVGFADRPPLASEIAFRIAPRINAAGRMNVASDVVRLLLTRDPGEAEELALRLHTLNEERRNVEAAILLELHKEVDLLVEAADATKPAVFVLDGQGWHRGVIGILASRVVERTQRAALVITHDDGAAHGSGRSVEGFHLLDALTAVHAEHLADQGENLFLRFGGHAHAVGFSLESPLVPSLRSRLLAHAEERAQAHQHAAVTRVDAALPLSNVNAETWQWVNRLQPFGNGNEEPVFLAQEVRLLELRTLKERHLKLRVEAEPGVIAECLCWGRDFSWPQRLRQMSITAGDPVDLLYCLRWNERSNFAGLEIHVCDLRRSSAHTVPSAQSKDFEAIAADGRPIY